MRHPLHLLAVTLLSGLAGAQSWQAISTTSAPSARFDAAAAYDVYRGVTVVFGGNDGTTTPLDDTNEWNGSTWQPRVTVVRPPRRWGHAMAFDSRRGKAVLFGGFRNVGGVANDTWEWDGIVWQQRAVASPPPARAFHGMVFDAARGVCVLFGGSGATGAALGDTWEYDGTTWAPRPGPTAPSPRASMAMIWDEERRQTLLFGGGDGAQVYGDTWWWTGSSWLQLPTPTAPSPRWAAQIAHDGNCGRTVLFGGADAGFGTTYGDAWEWTGAVWQSVAGPQPPARSGAALVHDAQRNAYVLWGGRDGAGLRADTWELGASCQRTMSVVTPPVVGQTAQFRYSYPAGAASLHFCWTLVTPRQPSAFTVPIPGIPSIGACRVDLFNVLLDPATFLDATGQLTTGVVIPPSTAFNGYPFDVQSVDLDLATLSLRWASTDAEVTVAAATPVAAFTAAPASGAAPLTVTFSNASQWATSYVWDFGDGTSSTAANPPAKVYVGGSYTVSLTATGPGGSATAQQQVVVTGANAAPVASFTATPTSGNAPLVVQFTDTSTQFPTAWQWDFDNDGVVDSTQQNPSWTYTNVGVYSVRMVATNFVGSGTVTNSGLVFAGPITPNPALNMVAIPPGTFLMGTTAGFAHEGPVHQVTISRPFWIGRYETTQAQYQAVMGTNPSYFQGINAPNASQRPVENVSWNMAVAYCSALTALEQAAGRVPAGYHYRLPTEAEWEYCCRAGTTTEWNTGTSLNTSQANFQGVLANSVYGAGQTAVVGSYAPNAFGLYDTHGNVWEWALDSLVAYSSSAPVVDPFVTGLVDRVRRGGSFDNLSHSGYCRSTRRGSSGSAPLWACGYRVVLGPIVNP